jgi:uncharacterized membrane protein YbhN (UPF0104 family)
MTARRATILRRALVATLALGGAALLVVGAHGLDFGDLGRTLIGVKVGWVVLAALLEALSLACGAAAWRVGLGAGGLGKVPLRHVMSAHWIGQASNTLLPARLGEAARVMALRRHVHEEAPVARIAGSLVAQRMLGGVASFVLVASITLALPLPGPLGTMRWGALAAVGLAIVAVLANRRWGLWVRLGSRLRLPSRMAGIGHQVAAGAGVLSCRRSRTGALLLHLGELVTQLGSIMALLRAFDLDVPLSAALVIFCLTAIAGLLPALPGGLGITQAALVAPLGAVYGVGAPLALAFSLGLQATVVGVSLLGGGVALVHQALSRIRARRAAVARVS